MADNASINTLESSVSGIHEDPKILAQDKKEEEPEFCRERTKESNLEDKLAKAHENLLPKKQLIVVIFAMATGTFTSFVDQTCVTIALTHIAKDLGAEKTISWAGIAAMTANTVFQVMFGRLSDIFGRKNVLLCCFFMLSIFSLACGFAQTDIQFFIFRAFCGLADGGIQSLTMVIISDIVNLRDRGKYQGILGAMVGLGNSAAPFLMSAFITHRSWRDFYYMLCPLVLVVAAIVFFLVPSTHTILSTKDKLKNIDYYGFFFSSIGLVLVLIPLNGGGISYAWDSVKVIVMFVIGGICLIVFMLIEWKVSKLPMIPLRLFTYYSLSLILYSNFFYGIAYYSFLYYMPYYFQIVKNKSLIVTSCFMLPIVLTQSVFSIISGQILSRTGRYKYIIVAGYGLWTISCGLLLLWSATSSQATDIGVTFLMGVGVGLTFQPTLVAAQAHSKKADRAVVISTRNVIRSLGGALGIAFGSLIISNTLLKQLKTDTILPDSYKEYLRQNVYTKISLEGLTPEQALHTRKLYMVGLKNLFYLYVPLMALCFFSSILVKDRGLQSLDEKQVVRGSSKKETAEETSNDGDNKEVTV